jgi:hypothetical protein
MSRSPAPHHLLAARRIALFVAVASFVTFGLFLGGGAALAQPTSPHGNLDGGVGDVPAGPGTIDGRVVHRVGRAGAEGLSVRLFALGPDGRPGMREERTGAGGAFRFANVSSNPGTFYLLTAQYGEIPFGERLTFDPGESKLTTVIEIAELSPAATAAEVGAVQLRLERGCAGVRVTESHVLRNPTDTVLYVPTSERATQASVYDSPLPAAANSVMPGRSTPEGALVQRGDAISFWGPLYPGEQAIEFSYSLTGADGTLAVERSFARGAESVTVLTFDGAPLASGESLVPADDEIVDEVRYAAARRGAIAPDAPFTFAWDVDEFAPGASRLSIREARLWLELDDAALDVREQYTFEVSGDEALRSESDAPLLCLPLPPVMEGMRFSQEAFAMGVEPGAGGGLALRGPIPAGRSGFALSYLLQSNDNSVHFTRNFGTHLSLLTVMIADNGVRTATDRLHNRRPMRTSDRTYLHLEGFEIEPTETVAIDLTSLPPKQPLPRSAAIGFVTASALLSVMFLIAPLRAKRTATESAQSVEAEASEGERTAVYAAIRDLEDDFETGKVSEEDHELMLGELRAHAAELLRQERDRRESKPAATTALTETAATTAPTAATAVATVTAIFCTSCGARLSENARFCAQCGGPVESAQEPHG